MFPQNSGPEERTPMPGIMPEEMVARISLVDASAGRETEYGTNVRWSTLSPQRVVPGVICDPFMTSRESFRK